MKFSIIVPVYKVEAYLPQCVNSILEQGYGDFELILVDDGSPDNSPQMCDGYALADSRIRVVHKENGGLSSARNAGIEVAVGEYLVFVDSDDWIDAGCLQEFANVLQRNPVDVLMTVKTSVYEDNSFMEVTNFSDYLQDGFDKRRAVEWLLYYSKSVGAPNKIIKRDMVEKNHIRFFEGILHEDYDWTFKICLYADSFAGYDGPWYNYRMVRDGSITNVVSAKSITSVIKTTRIYYDLFRENHDWIHECIYHRSMDALYVSLNKIKNVDEDSLSVVIDSVKDNRDVFKYAGKLNQHMFLLALHTMGPKIALKILKHM